MSFLAVNGLAVNGALSLYIVLERILYTPEMVKRYRIHSVLAARCATPLVTDDGEVVCVRIDTECDAEKGQDEGG